MAFVNEPIVVTVIDPTKILVWLLYGFARVISEFSRVSKAIVRINRVEPLTNNKRCENLNY